MLRPLDERNSRTDARSLDCCVLNTGPGPQHTLGFRVWPSSITGPTYPSNPMNNIHPSVLASFHYSSTAPSETLNPKPGTLNPEKPTETINPIIPESKTQAPDTPVLRLALPMELMSRLNFSAGSGFRASGFGFRVWDSAFRA